MAKIRLLLMLSLLAACGPGQPTAPPLTLPIDTNLTPAHTSIRGPGTHSRPVGPGNLPMDFVLGEPIVRTDDQAVENEKNRAFISQFKPHSK